MAKEKNDSPFFKVKQICLTGLTLKMFEADVKDKEIPESRLAREIIKEHYKKNPPIGFRGATG